MKNIFFVLKNKFDWDLYEKKVYKDIINIDQKICVTWDLKNITEIPPFNIILKQITLMNKNKKIIKKNIKKNIIIVNSIEKKNFLLWIFNYIYKPVKDTIINVI